MGLFDWITRRTPTTLGGLYFPAAGNHAGIHITPETAMAASAVYSCVGVISSAVAALPVHVTRRRDRERQDDHPVSLLLNGRPNEEMNAADFREAFMVNLLLWGHATAWIQRNGDGEATGLYPLRSAVTSVERDNGRLFYRTLVDGKPFELAPADVLHLKAMSFDGLRGISPISQASNAIGLSLAMEKYGAKFFANGGNVSGFIGLPAGMKKEAIEAFAASWKKEFVGSENALKTALLTDGMTYTKTGTDPEAAQMIDSRVFQVREIARIYRVPLHMIGDLERATFSNIEHQSIQFVQQTVMPWTIKLEQEASAKLFSPREQATLDLRFNLDSLLRADTAGRYTAYNQGRQGGWLSVNDIRRKEGLPPVDGGDELLSPLNMTPVGSKEPAAEPT